MKKIVILLICALMITSLVPFSVFAADATVVYVKDGGVGDGSSPEKAIGSIPDAFEALDLTKDCTIVVCGPLTQTTIYDRQEEYTGSVTITSVYNGVDYGKTADAELFVATRFFMYGDMTIEHIALHLTSAFWLVVAQCHEIVFGEGIVTYFDGDTTGLNFAKAISILGGFQGNAGMTELECTKDTNITVLSGDNYAICAYNRQFEGGNHTGKSTITIGGTAKVGCVYFASVNYADTHSGDVEITVKDNAEVQYILGDPNKPIVYSNSVTVNWLGGTIQACSTKDAMAYPIYYVPDTTVVTNGTTLRYVSAVKTNDWFELVTPGFDTLEEIKDGETPAPVATEAPATEAPATEAPATEAPATEAPATEAPATEPPATEAPATQAPATDAPVVTTEAPAEPEDTPATGDASVLLVVAAAAIFALAGVIVIKKKIGK